MFSKFSLSKLPLISKLYNNTNTRDILFSVGLGYLAFKTANFLIDFIPQFFYFEPDMSARYGKGSWAIVTGASDGIGREYSLQLARRGFNIILIARNEEKLAKVKEEIKQINPNVESRIIVADFANSYEEGFFETILQQIGDLDVSILINNVGVMIKGALANGDPQNIKESIIVNILPMTLLSRYLIPRMTQRKQRSAIINISSFAGFYVRPYIGLYSSTKVFNDFLSRAIAVEYPQLDILSVCPAFVSTKMLNYKPEDFNTATTEDVVNTTFRYLGKRSHTSGHWKHRLDAWKFSILPDGLRMTILTRRSRGLAK